MESHGPTSTRFHGIANSLCYNLPVISRYSRFFALCSLLFIAGCSGHLPQNNDPKAMAQWKERYGDNDTSSQVLNTMPRDDLDRVVELKAVPKRVLVIGPGATEIVYALGLESKLVGRDSASDFPPDKVQNLPIVGDFNGPNIERALAANPDLVILQGETYGVDRADAWQKQIGAPVACIAATTVAGLLKDSQKIGTWLGQNQTKPLFALNSVPSSSRKSDQPSAIIEIERQPFMTAGGDTLVGDVLRQAGFSNSAQPVDGYKPFNLEILTAHPPQWYIVTSNTLKSQDDVRTKLASERVRVLEELRGTSGIKNLPCVQQGRVLVVPADWMLRPGPRVALAIAEMARQRSQLGMEK